MSKPTEMAAYGALVIAAILWGGSIVAQKMALGSFSPGARVKLDEISKILGLTGKPEGLDGSRVEELVLAGQIEEVARYC